MATDTLLAGAADVTTDELANKRQRVIYTGHDDGARREVPPLLLIAHKAVETLRAAQLSALVHEESEQADLIKQEAEARLIALRADMKRKREELVGAHEQEVPMVALDRVKQVSTGWRRCSSTACRKLTQRDRVEPSRVLERLVTDENARLRAAGLGTFNSDSEMVLPSGIRMRDALADHDVDSHAHAVHIPGFGCLLTIDPRPHPQATPQPDERVGLHTLFVGKWKESIDIFQRSERCSQADEELHAQIGRDARGRSRCTSMVHWQLCEDCQPLADSQCSICDAWTCRECLPAHRMVCQSSYACESACGIRWCCKQKESSARGSCSCSAEHSRAHPRFVAGHCRRQFPSTTADLRLCAGCPTRICRDCEVRCTGRGINARPKVSSSARACPHYQSFCRSCASTNLVQCTRCAQPPRVPTPDDFWDIAFDDDHQ